VLDYWLARRQRRREIAAVSWTATLFALPGAGLALALRRFWRDAEAELWGFASASCSWAAPLRST
jgi:hypothetical protein